MKSKLTLLYKILKRLDEDKVSVYAAQTSFFLIISSVPLLMLMTTLLRYILIIDRDTFYSFILNILPADNEIFTFIDNLLDEILRRTDFPIISVSAITLLWSSSRGFRSIARAIRNIYRSKEGTNFIKNTLFSFFYTIIFILIFTLSIALMFFGKFIHDIINAQEIIFFVILILVFSLAYKGMARHEMKFRYHMIGAIFSAVGWLIFSYLYKIYIDRFSNYSYIYGSLTAIILMMLWLYMCIIILFLGAEINVWIYNKLKNTKNIV